MKADDLNFNLPKELVAEKPVRPRDAAKLMKVDKNNGRLSHFHFYDLEKILKSGDVLVFNKSKVFPARIMAKKSNGREVEVLFLNEIEPGKWAIIIDSKVQDGDKLNFKDIFIAEVEKKERLILKVPFSKKEIYCFLEVNGQMPLPPYIKRKATKSDVGDYQNIFASEIGSAAAPTAGLHFTKNLLSKLKKMGVQVEYVTLHVGIGTFSPIKTENVEEHQIHTEFFELSKETANRLNQAKKTNRRIIACGTTSVRVLETASCRGLVKAQKDFTDIFIYPGYEFSFIDGMITNFHTPRSSLLALVYAFAGETLIKKAYQEAIEKRYRFFSYGDGMIIL